MTLRLAAIFFLLCAVSASAGEKKRVSIHRGVASVEVPAEWTVEEAGDGAVEFSYPNDTFMLTFYAPDPDMRGGVQTYAKTFIDAVFKELEGGEIVREEQTEFNGRPGVIYHAEIPFDEELLKGMKMPAAFYVFETNGHAVICDALLFFGDPEEYFGICREIVDSYEFDTKAAAENADLLRELGETLREDLEEYLAE